MELESPAAERLEHKQLESHRVVHELLTANPQQDDYKTKCTAIIHPRQHQEHVIAAIQKCRYAPMAVSVEQSNFEAAMKQLDEILSQNTTLRFVLVSVTGTLSPNQMEQLISKARGSVRLILLKAPGLMSLLNLLDLTDRIWTPHSIEEASKSETIIKVEYDPTCAVGSIVCWCNQYYLKHPQELNNLNTAPAFQALHKYRSWQNDIEVWQAQQDGDIADDTLCILITPDQSLVFQKFKNSEDEVIDASESRELENLDSALDPSRPNNSPKKLQATSPRRSKKLLVLTNAHHLADRKVFSVISRCYNLGYQLLLVTPDPALTW